MSTAFKCVGGPYDGKTIDQGGRVWFSVMRAPETPVSLNVEPIEVTVTSGLYRRRYDLVTDRYEYIWQGWEDDK
jgi:hypothetical protein